MEKLEDLKFQFAESKTFEEGYRGAWFRCKINDINLKKNWFLPEYFDFPDEAIKKTKIYDMPDYSRKTKQFKRQLMVRPAYPQMYQKSEMPAVNSIKEVCVVIDGKWKVGDLVDWFHKDVYWAARVIEIWTDDTVQIELPMPPHGEGDNYKAFCKDLRPSLAWSPKEGWAFATMKGQTPSSAQFIFPSQQGMDVERVEVASPLNASSTSRVSVAPVEEKPLQNEEVKKDCDEVGKASSSDSISTMREEESKTNDGSWETDDPSIIDLNIMHEETLEASILDLEELANRIKWLKNILNHNQLKSESWMFAG